jgi:IS30 family transposase
MGITKQQRATWPMRGKVYSPGAPSLPREHSVRFWEAIARGQTTEEASAGAGVASAVDAKWFRQAGGMRPISLAPPCGRYLSLAERAEIAIEPARGSGVRTIARHVGRSPSTISRELRRNAATRSDCSGYRATVAEWPAQRRTRRPKVAKLVVNERIHDYAADRLSGLITRPDGTEIRGPTVRFKGRRHGPRQDRRWANAWSPEQISKRLELDFPGDETMRISHEAIDQSLFAQGRGALKGELVTCLRTGRALRVPRTRTKSRGKSFITPEVMMSERPPEVEDRAVPGHWEGDLIIGLDKSAIATLVERTTRFTMLLHLPPLEGHGTGVKTKNGPPLAGHGAEAVRDAIAGQPTTLPSQLRRSLTRDHRTEMANHAKPTIDTRIAVYFANPHSPWTRGTNDITNSLLPQYLPKGTDLAPWDRDDPDAAALNTRPRKTLDWRTPPEALDALPHSAGGPGVATTR